jgi:hypothetical protein
MATAAVVSQPAPCDALCPEHQCLRFSGGSFLSYTNELDIGSALGRGRSARTMSLPPSQLHSHVAAYLAATWATLWHALQLGAPCRSTPCGWTHHVAACLVAGHTISQPPSQLHTLHHRTPSSCKGHVAVPLAAMQPHRSLPYSCTLHCTGHISTCTQLDMTGFLTTWLLE